MCSELRRISVTDEVLQPPKGSDPAQISFGCTAGCRGVWALPVLQLEPGTFVTTLRSASPWGISPAEGGNALLWPRPKIYLPQPLQTPLHQVKGAMPTAAGWGTPVENEIHVPE